MLKHRFSHYIVGTCIVAFLVVSYVGYRAYQKYVEFQALMSNAQAFNRSIVGQHDHSSDDHTHHGKGAPVASDSENTGAGEQTDSGPDLAYQVDRTPDGDYVYNIADRLYASKEPMTQNSIEIQEWLHTGKMTPAVKEVIQVAEELREESELNVIQTVVTPDGKLHKVIVPKWAQYEEGDALLQSELDPPEIDDAALGQKPWLNNQVEIDGVWHSPPEEYYSIEDPYERRAYFNKFSWSLQHGISMTEVEKKIAAGELPAPLSEFDKRRVDEIQPMIERIKMLAPSASPLSDKPPVKVSFLPDEDPGALPGWARKGEGELPLGSDKAAATYSGADTFSDRGINEDARGGPVRSNVPLSPSDLSRVVESLPSPPSVANIENQLTPEGIAAELSEGLSTNPFDKAQQLIDQYGTEEGLRRLREMDPEAARRFESDKSRPGQGRRPSEPTRDTSDDAASTQ